jgi:hypothetical protein
MVEVIARYAARLLAMRITGGNVVSGWALREA